MSSLPPPPPGSPALPPPPPPRGPVPPVTGGMPPPPPPPPRRPSAGGVEPPSDEWQLPGDRWGPRPVVERAPRPGWVTEPVGWQHVASPHADPLVPTHGFGDWWGKLIGALGRSWRSLLALHLLALPLSVATAASAHWLPRPDAQGVMTARQLLDRLAGTLAVTFAWMVVSTLVRGAGCWLVVHDAAGRSTSWRDAVRFGMRRFWPFVGWSMVTGLAMAVGTLLCLVPGLYLLVVFGSVLTGVVAFERRDTWRRCFALARGAWWGLLGRLLVVGLVAGGVALGAAAVGGGVAASSGSGLGWLLAVAVTRAAQLPAELFGAVMAVVTYAERRAATGRCGTADLLDDLRT